jgi:hypothetical protein
MAERSDLTTFWEESPRIVEVADPSSEIVLQDLHDTLKSNTEQASENDDSLDNMDDEPLIDSAGKEDLGGGVSVGITSTLQNAQVAFESRLSPASTGTITTQDTNGQLLIDASGTLVTDGVTRGAVVINFTDQSITEILEVLSNTQARTRVLRAGTDNQFDVSDSYKIWNIEQCNILGGNLVAVDDLDASISPVFPTAFTQIVRTSSASATLQNQEQLQFSTYAGAVAVDPINGTAGTTYPLGTPGSPVDNLADALVICEETGLNTISIRGSITISAGDFSAGYIFKGQSPILSTFTVTAGANVANCEFLEATVSGDLSNNTVVRFGIVNDVTMGGYLFQTALGGTVTLTASLSAFDCWSLIPGTSHPHVDANDTVVQIGFRNYTGGIGLTNFSQASSNASFDLVGTMHIEPTVTNGIVVVRGTGTLNDNSTGSATIVNDGFSEAKHARELYRNEGLEEGNPMTVTPTSRSTANGDVDLTLSGDGLTSTTVTRNP